MPIEVRSESAPVSRMSDQTGWKSPVGPNVRFTWYMDASNETRPIFLGGQGAAKNCK